MKAFIVLSAILSVSTAFFDRSYLYLNHSYGKNKIFNEASVKSDEYISGTYETPLDHFSPIDDRVLQLKYTANVQFFNRSGPLFFLVRSGFSYNGNYIEDGLVKDLAEKLNGTVITATSRYFDDNLWGDLTVENLKYLTVDHILADIPHLILKVKTDLKTKDSRVIVFGDRESGTIAVLARKRFPHLIDGAWSSSGRFRSLLPDTTFLNAVARNLYTYGSENCTNTIRHAFAKIQQLITSQNAEEIKTLFNLCQAPNLNSDQETQFLYSFLLNAVPTIIDNLHLPGITELCDALTSESDSEPLNLYSKWFLTFDNQTECFDLSYENEIKLIQDVTHPIRARLYRDCIQLGLYFTVTPRDGFGDIFPNVINQSYYDRICSEAFGKVYNFTLLQIARDNFNIQHGSQSQVVTNAIFSNGGLDPMIGHAVIEYDIYGSESLTTPSIGTAADLNSFSETDPIDLQETKERIIQMLTHFASTYDFEDEDGWE